METRLLICLVLGLSLATWTPAVTAAATDSVLNVKDFGALGDGETDDTAAIQKALDTAGEAPGTKVFLPVGNYMVKGHLSIPAYTTLEGVWQIPTAWSQEKGSTLLAVEGEGSEEGPAFITINMCALLKGVTIFYPNQEPKNIKPYPWCIACGGGDNPSIIDVMMVNPYNGVDFGTKPSGRHFIRNLYGQPLKIGIYIDQCYDVGRIENVHFWPFWKGADYTRKHGEAFVFARTDWQFVTNTFCWGYKIGYKFIQSKSGACNGNFLGISADAAEYAVYAENTSGPGLLITNGEFVSFINEDPVEIVTAPTYQGLMLLQNCSFWGPAKNIARLEGSGQVNFQNCLFRDWSHKEPPQPAIDNISCDLMVTECTFKTAAPQVHLGKDVKKAIVKNNFCRGIEGIFDNSDGHTIIESNIFDTMPDAEDFAIVVDDSFVKGSSQHGYFETVGEWNGSGGEGNFMDYTHWAEVGDTDLKARWTPNLPKTGKYEVFIWNGPDPNQDHATNVPVTIKHKKRFLLGDTSRIKVDSTKNTGGWYSLGTYPFSKGEDSFVEITNTGNGNILADAVKFVPR